jgi:hypothetical protein
VFDKDSNRLGFIPSFVVPIPTVPYDYKVLIIIVSVIGGVIILSIAICIILMKVNSKGVAAENKIDLNGDVVVVRYKKPEPVIEAMEDEENEAVNDIINNAEPMSQIIESAV